MRATSGFFDILVDIHITAGINIKYIMMHISQLECFFPDNQDKHLIQNFKPVQNKDHMIATGVFGWWKGVELRYSTDINKDLIYAVSDEKEY